MSIQNEFVLRYREDGHVRFQIPARICNVDAAKALTDGISQIDGVYRVKLFCSQYKLSIRFEEAYCDFKSLARQLFNLLAELEKKANFRPGLSQSQHHGGKKPKPDSIVLKQHDGPKKNLVM